MKRPQFISLQFVEEGVEVRAKLLWDEAPVTCAAVLDCLPSAGQAHHAIYSGSECVHLLRTILRLDPEHATADVRRGQVAFTWMAAGSSYGVEQDFAEICWFYDHDAQPRMWEGPVPVNVFAELVDDAGPFYAVCRRMRREGVKPFRVEAIVS